MFVFEAEKVDSGIVRAFLEKHEQSCVFLCSHVRKGGSNVFVFSGSSAINSEKDIFGVANIDSTILHCFPFLDAGKKNEDFDRAFLGVIVSFASQKLFLEKGKSSKSVNSRGMSISTAIKSIHCVNGEKSASDYIINLLEKHGKKIHQANQYYLMTKDDLDGIPLPASLLCMGEEIVCCNLDYADDLFDLQKQYLIEEVAPKGVNLTDEYVKSNVESILKEQKVFAISSDGQFVAKANTNAIGWNWIQIGGVYTNPLYRRNNYALCLVSTLGRRIIKNDRKTCLFVNKKNAPAVSLYKKMNFRIDCEFVICYGSL